MYSDIVNLKLKYYKAVLLTNPPFSSMNSVAEGDSFLLSLAPIESQRNACWRVAAEPRSGVGVENLSENCLLVRLQMTSKFNWTRETEDSK